MQFLFPLSSWEPYGSERIRRAPKYTLLTTKGQNLGLLTSGSVSSHLCQTVCRSNSRSMCNQQPGWEEKVNKGIKGKQRRTRLRGDSESLRRARKSSWRSSAALCYFKLSLTSKSLQYVKYHTDHVTFFQMLFQFFQFSHSVVSNSLWPHGLQHTRLPCPSPTPGVYSN